MSTIIARGTRAGATVVQHDGEHIPMSRWGNDHWSTLAYAETRAIDHHGKLDDRHMRARESGYPTRLNNNVDLIGHGDNDCLDDAHEEGLLVHTAGVVIFTDKGLEVTAALRAHKIRGGNWASFRWPVSV